MFNTLLVEPLFNILAIIYAGLPIHDFGLAIIILTILVRLLLWPLVNKQLHSQRAMQKLAPAMAQIKVEAKGDKALEGKMTMELYKERGINPFASFLPLLIQLPIFFALYVVLSDVIKPGEIERLAYEPVKQLGAIADIIRGTVKFDPQMLGLIDLAKPSPLLAILAGAAQFVQTKQLMPKHPTQDVQAQIMKTMTYIFPFMTFFIGLTLPSALALYWTVTSAMAVLQQTIVLRRDVEELEATPPLVVSSGNQVSKPTGKSVSKSKAKKRHKAKASPR